MTSTLYICSTVVLILSTCGRVNASNNSSDTTSTGFRSISSNIYGTMLLVVSVFVVLCNGIVVFVVLKTDYQNVSNLAVIAHMALWDLIQGLHVLVFTTPSAFLNRFAYTESMVIWEASFGSFSAGMAIFNTVALVIDRIVSLKKPFLYRKHGTKGKFAFIAFCVYIMAMVQMLLMIFPDADYIYNQTTALCIPAYQTTQGALAFAIPAAVSFGVIIVSSCVILREVSRGKRRVHTEQILISVSVRKRSLIGVLSAGVFCLSYVPIVVQVVMHAIVKNALIDELFSRFAVVSYFSNSIWNVLIYSVTYTPFRDAFLKIFCRSYYRRIKRQNQPQTQQTGINRVSRMNVQNPQISLTSRASVTSPETVNIVSLQQPENHGDSDRKITKRLHTDTH